MRNEVKLARVQGRALRNSPINCNLSGRLAICKLRLHDISPFGESICLSYTQTRYDINSFISSRRDISNCEAIYRIQKDISKIPSGIYIAKLQFIVPINCNLHIEGVVNT